MPTSVGPITASVPFASPNEGGGMSVPAFNGLPKPVLEHFHIIDMMPLPCSSLDDALDRLGDTLARSLRWALRGAQFHVQHTIESCSDSCVLRDYPRSAPS